MEGYLLAIDEQEIVMKATAKRRERDPTIWRQMDSKCRLCRKGEETLNHILASCEEVSSSLYLTYTLLRRGSQLSSIVCFIIAGVTADGPGPLKPDRKRKGNLCQNDYVLTYTLCVLTYISLYLCYHWSG